MKYFLSVLAIACFACQGDKKEQPRQAVATEIEKIAPQIISEKVPHDSDDPAIWIDRQDLSKSLILGNDKEENGGIYAFDLNGKIIEDKTVQPVRRPNNIDIQHGVEMGDRTVDIAVFTERYTESLRIIDLPSMQYLDNGGIALFTGEDSVEYRAPMGVALYRSEEGKTYAVVSRKNGPTDGTYLWEYELVARDSFFDGILVRKFGDFSGSGEIEAIAIDDELGYVYYSDEAAGIRKYHAHPDSPNTMLAIFGQHDFTEDREGIAIWRRSDGTGYIFVSDQQNFSFEIYTRSGSLGDPHDHQRLGEVFLSTIETDGCEVYPDSISPGFPNGIFLAMSEGAVYHYYDLGKIEEYIGSLMKE